jgi:protein involved in polysaccharide export with SLBB domain
MAARCLAIVALALLALCGCKSPSGTRGQTVTADSVKLTPEETQKASTLGAGDLLEVRVYQEPDLSGPFRVSPEGTIDYPLCGRLVVKDLSSSAAADSIRGCLANGFIKRPQVTVLIREYTSKKIFIFGEVAKPGTFPYEENMNIIQAVTMAGGFTRSAQKNNIAVTRVLQGVEKKIRVPVADIGEGREKNFDVQPGDIIFVPESIF